MKKIFALALSTVLVMSLFTACSTTAKSEKVKTGLAVVTEVSKSTDAGEKDGLAQANSTAVAVLVDQKGVIKNCVIDVIQPKINFNTAGELTTDLATVYISKQELKDDYGMRAASPIGKEWFEQADAFAKYVTGKTIDQVKGIAIEDGYPAEEDLKSSVTMHITEIVTALENAVANAQDLGASSDDKLGLGITSNLGKSKNASADGDGLAQAYTHYGVVSVDAKGKITSSIINASQGNVNFSVEGKITSDLAAPIVTKIELGDAYGMKGASPIGKEWFEQSKAFTDYITGKTVAEATGIAVEGGKATSADLTSSVTITINDFLTVIDKAGANAK